ncbi:LacI family DNA-binding transcriptional regulator [Pararhodobacter zhoushanensis]|uniref:LacI family DNA-binding transcriptional regulator n=1 Tax=Pararhodobacter zhoushanensis TaxID=2479545 RepID=A0ABT3H561_9RHOB|nr:LacI family DNA-binding transcriptional regulator [Pararhodobacter zhoushanensis]MCW1934924.1 LacI family DNA-binding transcriptional regulator [Pararhodobacter zhoushanensis]
MQAVGRMAGVSQVTVSRALSDPSKVSPETLARIHAAIAATGFVPNALAGALASHKSMLVSALVPSMTNIVYSSMLATFSEELRARGYQILLSETGFDAEQEAATVELHLSRRPDAILLTGVHHAPRTRKMLLGAGIPVVEVWDITETPIDLCVGFSHPASGHTMADFAVSAGYRTAVGFSAGDERARRRLAAFAERFSAQSGTPVPVKVTAVGGLAQGRAMLADVLDSGTFQGGLIACSSDVLAHGVLIEAAARNLTVPEDLAVIGFGDQDLAAAVEPPLTTIRVNREALGRSAASLVLARIRGEDPAHPVIGVGFSLIRRRSA